VANPWDWAHEAIDYACVAGTPVFAVQSGVVSGVAWVEVGTAGLRGHVDIELDGMPVRVEYVNLGRVVVEEGQTVAKGDTLGFSALGLQVGVWDREAGRYVDPAPFLALPATN
jgi:murein DD-endopeptidase MepM/ murein hydrolase activator NlpD